MGNGFFGQFWPVHAEKYEMSWAVSRKLPSSDSSSTKVLDTMNLSGQRCPVMVKSQTQVGGNLQVTKAHSERVITSEAVRPLTTQTQLVWNQWLAGLIDWVREAHLISKHGYTTCETTMGIRDEHALNQIQHK
jgi:hypothetical protein